MATATAPPEKYTAAAGRDLRAPRINQPGSQRSNMGDPLLREVPDFSIGSVRELAGLFVALHLTLFQPEIPPNTGNLIRLCANTGARLHLIRPMGFELDDRRLRRAGLDYHEWADVSIHDSLERCVDETAPGRVFAFTTRATRQYSDVRFQDDDLLLFGPETRGLPDTVLDLIPNDQRLRIPMIPGSRSMNLANCAAVAVFEAWRQMGFKGGR